MITKFKLYEKVENVYLLCVKETVPTYYWKFTKGKKYKLYFSNLGIRIKDDKGEFDRLVSVNNDDYWERTENNGIFTWEYAGGIFTTDKSIEDYNIRKKSENYNL